MKTYLIVILLLASQICIAQSKFVFTYDAAGNRQTRNLITPRFANIKDSIQIKTDPIPNYAIEIFPNPSSKILNVYIGKLDEGEKAILVLADIQGKILIKRETYVKQEAIDMNEFKNGNYFLKIIIKDEMFNYKVTKVD